MPDMQRQGGMVMDWILYLTLIGGPIGLMAVVIYFEIRNWLVGRAES